MEMKDYITVQSSISGYFAVYMTYDKELDTYIPYQTGIGRYKERKKAEAEAKMWAEAEEIEFDGE